MNSSYFNAYASIILLLYFAETFIDATNSTPFNNPFRLKRQSADENFGCRLPNHPPNGKLKILYRSEDYVPHTRVFENTIIDLSCREGYVTETLGLSRAICYMGAWKPTIENMGVCLRTCLPLTTESDTFSVICSHKNSKVTCEKPINGTIARVTCKPNFKHRSTQESLVLCEDGYWDKAISPCINDTQSIGDCVLPPHPPNGEFKLPGEKNYTYISNISVHEYASIKLYCKSDYIPDSDNPVTFCLAGLWTPDISLIGKCVRTCPSIVADTDSYTVQCKYKNNPVSCETPRVGTRMDIKCKTFFEYTATRPIIKCENDGSWNSVISPCSPECGKKRVGVQTLTSEGGDALKGEFPWLAGVYYASNKTHICGASIISRYYVLSAAHCFTTHTGVPFEKNNYLIAAGKYYRNLDDNRDTHMQIREIDDIYISPNYKGINQNFGKDFAVVTLKTAFQLTNEVQPVCVDWDNKFESVDFQENNKGVVTGWGYTEAGSNPAAELKKLVVPYKAKATCEKYMPKEFVERYYTYDKFCAGYIDKRMSVCNGDSGGGLYFPNYEFRFYVRGILSLAPATQDGCDPNQFALYTKVSMHLSDIEYITERKI